MRRDPQRRRVVLGERLSWRFGTNQVSGNQVNPVQVAGVETAVDVDVGSTSACARLADGTMACWGSNWTGQAGLAYSSPFAPTVIPEVPQVRAVELESSTGCAIWGDAAGLVLGMEQLWASR